MTSQHHADERLTVQGLRAEYGLSEKTWRRALSDEADPLPHQRVGLGDAKHARILVRRGDVEAWIARRHKALSVTTRSVVDEIVEKALA